MHGMAGDAGILCCARSLSLQSNVRTGFYPETQATGLLAQQSIRWLRGHARSHDTRQPRFAVPHPTANRVNPAASYDGNRTEWGGGACQNRTRSFMPLPSYTPRKAERDAWMACGVQQAGSCNSMDRFFVVAVQQLSCPFPFLGSFQTIELLVLIGQS